MSKREQKQDEKLGIEELKAEIAKYKTLSEGLQSENEQLLSQLEEADKRIAKGDEYLNQLVILKSDFEAFRKRNRDSVETSKEQGKLGVISQLLPILDTFDRARDNIKDSISLQAFEQILKQYMSILKELNVCEIEVLNQEFDVNTCNAISQREVDEMLKGKVVEVFGKGYKFVGNNTETVLRFATVCVGC